MIQVIKNIFGDISLLYKSFFHWNISKILIVIFAFFLWILVSLPFFAILWIVVYFDPIDWKDIAYNYYTTESFGLSLMTALSSYLWYIILEWILFILAVWFFMFGYSYKTIRLTKLNLAYLNQEKIEITKKEYFLIIFTILNAIVLFLATLIDINLVKIILLIVSIFFTLFNLIIVFLIIKSEIKRLFTYLWVISWISLILLVPFLLFLIIFAVTLFSLWGLDVVSNMVRESYTNPFTIIVWVSFFTLLLVFLYLAYRMSFSYVIMLDDKNYTEKQKALFYVKESFKISSGVKIFKFLLMVIIYTIILLPFDYIWGKVEEMELISILYWILIFFVFGWVFEMLVVSIYKNIMLWENNLEILNTEEKEEIV